MTRTFTDQEGNEYETASGYITYDKPLDLEDGTIIIKPIPKAVERKRHELLFGERTPDIANDQTYLEREYKLAPIQAQAIAAAIEALMEYIQSQVDGGKTTSQKHDTFVALAKAAGKAHKEDV